MLHETSGAMMIVVRSSGTSTSATGRAITRLILTIASGRASPTSRQLGRAAMPPRQTQAGLALCEVVGAIRLLTTPYIVVLSLQQVIPVEQQTTRHPPDGRFQRSRPETLNCASFGPKSSPLASRSSGLTRWPSVPPIFRTMWL